MIFSMCCFRGLSRQDSVAPPVVAPVAPSPQGPTDLGAACMGTESGFHGAAPPMNSYVHPVTNPTARCQQTATRNSLSVMIAIDKLIAVVDNGDASEDRHTHAPPGHIFNRVSTESSSGYIGSEPTTNMPSSLQHASRSSLRGSLCNVWSRTDCLGKPTRQSSSTLHREITGLELKYKSNRPMQQSFDGRSTTCDVDGGSTRGFHRAVQSSVGYTGNINSGERLVKVRPTSESQNSTRGFHRAVQSSVGYTGRSNSSERIKAWPMTGSGRNKNNVSGLSRLLLNRATTSSVGVCNTTTYNMPPSLRQDIMSPRVYDIQLHMSILSSIPKKWGGLMEENTPDI